MFRGVFEATIDAKGRTSLPAKFREVLTDTFGDERFFITNSSPVDMDRGEVCSGLVIYPHNEWLLLEERLLSNSGFTSSQRNSIIRKIFAPALPCAADKLGRVLVPPAMRKAATLERDIIFVGALKKIEIWSMENWEKVLAQADKDIPIDSQALADLGL